MNHPQLPLQKAEQPRRVARPLDLPEAGAFPKRHALPRLLSLLLLLLLLASPMTVMMVWLPV